MGEGEKNNHVLTFDTCAGFSLYTVFAATVQEKTKYYTLPVYIIYPDQLQNGKN